MAEPSTKRPNILLVVSDQERQRSWLPPDVSLPWRDRLRAEGLEFTDYFTHSSPCSPSRASLFTGRYLQGHGVVDNVIMPEHDELPTSTPTLGSLLAGSGYRSSYIGKWHLSHSPTPDMEAYGFADWDGNDRHFMGWAGTGVHFDPIIAANAAHWLEKNATPSGGSGSGSGTGSGGTGSGGTDPWFLTVALVNPHDVMWFPVDQPGYRERHPDDVSAIRSVLESAAWKDDDPLPIFSEPYPEVVDRLPANFDDDLHTKPEAHRQWRWDQQHGLWGYIDPDDKGAWLRHLDYYVHLHQLADRSLGTVLSALDASGAWDDTIVIFTSDHGDMCGSHGLRSKGPFVYDEIMRVPMYVKAPGVTTPGSATSALGSHVDLAATICSLAGVGDPRRVHGAGHRPVPGPCRSRRLGAGPHPVRPGLGPDHRAQQGALRLARLLRRPDQVRPLLRGRRREALDRVVGEAARSQAFRRGLCLRRQRPRMVRPRHRSRRAGQPGQRPLPAHRAPRRLRADAGL